MQKSIATLCSIVALALGLSLPTARALTREEIQTQSIKALHKLLDQNPTAQGLAGHAVGILVFPKIVKGGFIVAGQFGEGALFQGNMITGYYSTAAASVGYQAGLERYGYALFFMNQKALDYLQKSNGWSLGAGPSLVVVDKGFAKTFSTSTMKSDVYACVFSEKGLMGGIGVQGQKITRIHPK